MWIIDSFIFFHNFIWTQWRVQGISGMVACSQRKWPRIDPQWGAFLTPKWRKKHVSNTQTDRWPRISRGGTNLLPLGGTPPIATLSHEMIASGPKNFTILTSYNPNCLQLIPISPVLLEKITKNPSQKLFFEMQKKNLPLAPTTSRFSTRNQSHPRRARPLELAGRTMKESIFSIEKMFTVAISMKTTLLPSIKVPNVWFVVR